MGRVKKVGFSNLEPYLDAWPSHWDMWDLFLVWDFCVLIWEGFGDAANEGTALQCFW